MLGLANCDDCVPPRPCDAAVCALTSRGRLLFVRTRRLPDEWQPPGGQVEEGDNSIAATASRELREELGVTVKTHDLALVSVELSDVKDGRIYFFTASLPTGQSIRPVGAEILDHLWTTVGDASALALAPASRAFLRQYSVQRRDLLAEELPP